jgi:hypothetical protein
MKEFSNFSQIINGKYLESDILELILRENGHLENITQEIVELTISHLEPYLKKNFESKKYEILRQILGNSEENYNLIEKLLAPIENVLVNMDRNYGSLKIDNEVVTKTVSTFWDLPKKYQTIYRGRL